MQHSKNELEMGFILLFVWTILFYNQPLCVYRTAPGFSLYQVPPSGECTGRYGILPDPSTFPLYKRAPVKE
jgi:hypothetical protein